MILFNVKGKVDDNNNNGNVNVIVNFYLCKICKG